MAKYLFAGLVEVIMGIQSGSESLRRNVFHRYETQEDILNAARTIRDSGVYWATYDFMLQHPFESSHREAMPLARDPLSPPPMLPHPARG